MNRIAAAALSLSLLVVSACTPNQSIALDRTNDANAAEANKTPEPPPAPPTRITVSELIGRVLSAKPDSFLFPCTLNSYSDDDRNELRKAREQWMLKENDAQYLVSPSNCVCPGICVIEVEDTQKPEPSNSSILVIAQTGPKTLKWLAKDIDLTNTKLVWASSDPVITFYNPDGSQKYVCFIRIDPKTQKFFSDCGDGHKTFPSLESR